MVEHGGRLLAAAHQYGIEASQWIDLSTGANPRPWPVPEIPSKAFTELPQAEDDLCTTAKDYYGCQSLLPIAGSQAAIQILPQLRGKSNVGIVSPTYGEHAST